MRRAMGGVARFAAVAIGSLLAGWSGIARGDAAASDPRIDRRLLAAIHAPDSAARAALPHTGATLSADAEGRTLARVEFQDEASAVKFANGNGGTLSIEERQGRVLWLWVDGPALTRLIASGRLLYASLPFAPLPTHRSEGTDDLRAPAFQATGYRGQGVRVGVIDIGFSLYESRLGTELPASVDTRSFYGGANGNGDLTGGGESHGTACAEVIHDVAPDAELYLANVNSDLDLLRAERWMADEGVEVISHSLAWFVGGGDGTGPISDIVAEADRDGIVWVTSAGNFAQAHWGGASRDLDADSVIEFDAAGDESIKLSGLSSGSATSWVLYWNRWPTSTDLAFAIEMRADDGTLLATSETEFQDFAYAFRALDFTPRSGSLPPNLVIRRIRGDATGITLHLFRVDHGGAASLPEHVVREGSIAIPADSPAALSVGAYEYDANVASEGLRFYSSAGPTSDGRMKPEILGPDGVDNSVEPNFAGTSAACPHVAGAVALLLSASIEGGMYDARLTPRAVRRLLENEALPLVAGTRLPDAEGWGRARLVIDRPSARTVASITVERASDAGLRLVLQTPGRSATTTLRLFDLAGRHLATLAPFEISARTQRFELGDGWRAPRGRYWVRDPASGARASFYWPGRP